MGVYINMEMPKSCDDCRLNNGISCYAVPEYTEDGVVGRTDDRPDWCPLVFVPKHGRLVDADALMNEFEKAQRTMQQHGREYSCSFLSSSQELSTEWYCVEDMLENAPTVLEVEEGET